MKKLQEKILLEEPKDVEVDKVEMNVDELPPVELDAPITVDMPEISEEDKTNGFINILSSEVSEIYNNLASLKSILVTLNGDLPERTDVKDIIEEIINERTIHVGMIQKAIDLLSEDHKELVDAGEEKAEQIASETIQDTVD